MPAFTLNNTTLPLMPLPNHGSRIQIDAYHSNCSGEENIVAPVTGSYIFVERIKVTVQGVAGGVTFSFGFGATGSLDAILSGPFIVAHEETAAGYCHPAVVEFDYSNGRNMGRRGGLSQGLVGDCSAAVPMHVLADIVVAQELTLNKL